MTTSRAFAIRLVGLVVATHTLLVATAVTVGQLWWGDRPSLVAYQLLYVIDRPVLTGVERITQFLSFDSPFKSARLAIAVNEFVAFGFLGGLFYGSVGTALALLLLRIRRHTSKSERSQRSA